MDALWGRVVDVMLEHSCVHHGDRSHDETSSHLQDWTEVDLVLAKQWIYHEVKKRDEDDQGDRIEVLKQIIWSAVERHGSGLRDEIVPDLDPAHEVKRQEQEELSNISRRNLQPYLGA